MKQDFCTLSGTLIPVLYTLSDFICLCFLLLSPVCAAKFFLKGYIYSVEHREPDCSDCCCYILFSNSTHKDAVMFCDAISS